VAYRLVRTERAARLKDLEQLIQARKRGTRTLEDACAEQGLSEAEMQRLVDWLYFRLRLEERGGELSELPDEQRELEIAEALWANCRFTHGPGLCKENCPGDRQDVVERAAAEDVVEGPPAEKVPPYVGVGHDIWEPG
jgi:hypothetical protein